MESLLKNLKLKHYTQICRDLEISDWCSFASNLKRVRAPNIGQEMYTIAAIEHFKNKPPGKRSEELLNDYRTQNPKIKHIVEALEEAKCYTVLEYIYRELDIPRPDENSSSDYDSEDGELDLESGNKEDKTIPYEPGFSTSASSTSCSVISGRVSESAISLEKSAMSSLPASTGGYCPYEWLNKITNGFNETPIEDGGNLIGIGGFAKVFLGKYDDGRKVAVKRYMNERASAICQNQLQILGTVSHEFILSVETCSDDGPYRCIIFPYMENGTLRDRLAYTENTQPLSIPCRIKIAESVAKGLKVIHTQENPIVHRDIKSENILLDENFYPKISDFDHAVEYRLPNQKRVKVPERINSVGYTAPEALQTDFVSTKVDVYSYGVVLLELLTGLPAHNKELEDDTLTSLLKEKCDYIEDVNGFVDSKCGDWNSQLTESIYQLALNCLDFDPEKRLTMEKVVEEIGNWYQFVVQW